MNRTNSHFRADGSMRGIRLVVDGSYGIYVPQRFEIVSGHATSGVSDEDWAVLRAGPDHEHYWETWDSVVDNGRWADERGYTWFLHLHEGGDVFVMCDELMTDEEYRDFYGEDRFTVNHEENSHE